jgi:hypothetical protein
MNFDHFTRSDRVEIYNASVRLVSLHDETLRERTHRGRFAIDNAKRQAEEWSELFNVPITEVEQPFGESST